MELQTQKYGITNTKEWIYKHKKFRFPTPKSPRCRRGFEVKKREIQYLSSGRCGALSYLKRIINKNKKPRNN